MVDIINNTSKLLGDDLKTEIKEGSRFLFKMRKNGFAYLNTPHIPFGNIAAHLSDGKRLPVQKRDRIVERVYFFTTASTASV